MSRIVKIKPVFLIICCLLWMSCSKNDKLPRDILPVEKMSRIMLDLQIAKAYNYSYFPDQDTTHYPRDQEKRLKILYQQVFLLHHTDTAHFFKSFRFYSGHPDWLKKVYHQMQDSLERKQDRQQALVQERRKEKKRLQADKNAALQWLKQFQTWHAFSDTAYEQCSMPSELLKGAKRR